MEQVSLFAGHKRILPKSFVNPDIYEHFAKEYMFLACIKYITQVGYLKYLKALHIHILSLLKIWYLFENNRGQ